MTNGEKFKEIFGYKPYTDEPLCSICKVECQEKGNCKKCEYNHFWAKDFNTPVDYKEQLLKASAKILKDYCGERDCSECIFEHEDGCNLITIPQYFKLEEVNDG